MSTIYRIACLAGLMPLLAGCGAETTPVQTAANNSDAQQKAPVDEAKAMPLTHEAKKDAAETTTSPHTEQATPEPPSQEDTLSVIRQRMRDDVLFAPINPAKIQEYVQSQSVNGSWQDISFEDTNPFPGSEHTLRIQQLALGAALAERNGNQEEARQYLEACQRALDFLAAKDLRITRHLFAKKIGMPRHLGQTAILVGDSLTSGQLSLIQEYLQEADFRGDRVLNKAQNRLWRAESLLVLAILNNDLELAALATNYMNSLARRTAGEGLQHDDSFHQHGPLLNTFAYGRAYAENLARWFVINQGTALAFPASSIELIEDFVLNHQQWLVWGEEVDYGTRGRAIVRGMAPSRALKKTVEYLLEAGAPRQAELQALLNRIEQAETAPNLPPLTGTRHFWKSDFMVHRTPEFYASIRSHSKRTRNTDKPHNGENLKGHHLSDGVTLLKIHGNEYREIQPVWDWQMLPGSTVVQTGVHPSGMNSIARMGETVFVGGVAADDFGIMAADFKRDDLKVRQSWFVAGPLLVALGTGIESQNTEHPVYTTVNQALGAEQATQNGKPIEQETLLAVSANQSVEHDGLSYLIGPRSSPAWLRLGQQKGSWRSISRLRPSGQVQRQVFKLWFDHGQTPDDASYAYAVYPTAATAESSGHQFGNSIQVLVNEPNLQAVYLPRQKWVGVVFYESGKLLCPKEKLEIHVDQPCVLMVRKESNGDLRYWITDPSQQLDVLELTIRQASELFQQQIQLPQSFQKGTTVSGAIPRP